MSKKTILNDSESVYSMVDTIESPSKKRKMWNPPMIILLKLFDIQSGDGSGAEASHQGVWQPSLGS